MGTSHEKNLAAQLRMFEGTWQAFQAHGVTDETELVLDFCFVAPDEMKARALMTSLETGKTDLRQGGFLLWKKWYVEGQTEPMRANYDALKQWIEEMVETGWKHSCEFDGFGARMPS